MATTTVTVLALLLQPASAAELPSLDPAHPLLPPDAVGGSASPVGEVGALAYNGEYGLLDMSTAPSWSQCNDATWRNNQFIDRDTYSYMKPYILARSLGSGSHSWYSVTSYPGGSWTSGTSTFSGSGDWCLSPPAWTLTGSNNRRITGTWTWDYYLDGSFVTRTIHYLGPRGPRDTGDVHTPVAFSGTDCQTTPISSIGHGRTVGFRFAFDNWASVAAKRQAKSYTVKWTRPDGTTTTYAGTWSQQTYLPNCVTTSTGNYVGTWRVEAYFNSWISARDALSRYDSTGVNGNLWSDYSSTFEVTNTVPYAPNTPTTTSPPAQYVRGTSYEFCSTGWNDADSDAISPKFKWADQSSDVSGSAISGGKSCTTRTFSSVGTFTVTARGCDTWGCGSYSSGHSITVVNRAPTFSSGSPTVSPTSVYRGDTVTATGKGTDPDGDSSLTFEVDWTSAGDVTTCSLTSGSATGCSTTKQYTTLGSKSPKARLKDQVDSNGVGGWVNLASISVNNRAPTIAAPSCSGGPTYYHNSPYSCEAAVTDADMDNGYDSGSCTWNWGDGNTNSPGTMTGSGSSRKCTGTHTWTGVQSYTFSATVSDGHTSTTSGSSSITMSNRAVTTPSSISVTPAGPYHRGQTITASVTTTDQDGDSWYCQFDWGDSTSATVGSPAPTASGQTCSASHTYASTVSIGDKIITAKVRDTFTSSYPATGVTKTITISNRNPDQPGAPSCSQSGAHNKDVSCTAYISDPDSADQVKAAFNWGDGSQPSETSYGTNPRTTSPATTHSYSTSTISCYSIDVTTKDNVAAPNQGERRGSSAYSACLTNAAPSVGSISCSPSGNIPRGTSVQCSWTGTDPDGDSISYTIDWGDGTVESGVSSPRSHTYGKADRSDIGATYTPCVTPKDSYNAQGPQGCSPNSVTIINRAPTKPVFTAIPTSTYRGVEVTVKARSTEPDSGDKIQMTFDWGDGSQPCVTQFASPDAFGNVEQQCTHTYQSLGSKCVTVVANDDVHQPYTAYSEASNPGCIVVNNQPPVARPTTNNAWFSGDIAVFLPGQQSFSGDQSYDPDKQGPCSNGNVNGIANWRWNVYYGVPESGQQAAPQQSGSTMSTVEYSIAIPGVYTLTLVVTDCEGADSTPARLTFIV